ncbi:MAG: DUF1295 domain-containing protein [Reichenbachiella sp.]
MKKSKLASSIIVTLIYLVAMQLGGFLLFYYELTLNPLLSIVMVDVICTTLVFAFSYLFKNSSIYDPYWSVIPPCIVHWLVYLFDVEILKAFVVSTAISIWAIRLTLNWLRGWSGLLHEDWRYIRLAKRTGKAYWLVSYLGIHMFPTLIVLLGCLPVYLEFQVNGILTAWNVVGAIVCVIAALIQLISDEQMRIFRKEPNNKGKIIQSGLWAYSRHPNYLGEIIFWFGLWVITWGNDWMTILFASAGFVSMYLLFRYISIPMMEQEQALKRKGFDEYIKKIPVLLPRLLTNVRKRN